MTGGQGAAALPGLMAHAPVGAGRLGNVPAVCAPDEHTCPLRLFLLLFVAFSVSRDSSQAWLNLCPPLSSLPRSLSPHPSPGLAAPAQRSGGRARRRASLDCHGPAAARARVWSVPRAVRRGWRPPPPPPRAAHEVAPACMRCPRVPRRLRDVVHQRRPEERVERCQVWSLPESGRGVAQGPISCTCAPPAPKARGVYGSIEESAGRVVHRVPRPARLRSKCAGAPAESGAWRVGRRDEPARVGAAWLARRAPVRLLRHLLSGPSFLLLLLSSAWGVCMQRVGGSVVLECASVGEESPAELSRLPRVARARAHGVLWGALLALPLLHSREEARDTAAARFPSPALV